MNGALGVRDVTFSGNSAQGGNGGSADTFFGGAGGGGGAGLGSAVFNDGSYCVLGTVTYSANTVGGGAAGIGKDGFGGGPGPAYPGQAVDTSPGIYDHTGDHSCAVWYYPPTDITFTPASLDENRPVGTLAGTLSATDPDVGDTFTYSLVSGDGSADNADFAISGNTLVTHSVLDYETKSTYSVRLRVTDSHTRFYEEPFTITIHDVNDPPTEITLSAATVAENSPAGTLVGSLSSSDPETGETFTYTLVNPGPTCSGAGNTAFAIIGDTLRTAASLDYESQSSYAICIRSTDSGIPNQSFDKPFTITITDRNDAPTDITLSANTVTENEPSGTLIGSLTAMDADAGQSFTYSLVNVAGCSGTDNASFSISGDALFTTTSFDYEAQSSYAICIQTTDNGAPMLSYYEPFTISVTDANDAPTDIQLSETSLAENQPIGTLIGDLFVTDQDAGQSYTYSFSSSASCSGTDNASFTISGNILHAAASFDYESKSSYQVCIAVMDDGVPALGFAKEFTITVADVNTAPTDITLSSSSLSENQPAGVLVGDLAATGQDNGQTIAYSLASVGGCTGTDNPSFAISGSTLLTAASFDFETKASYNICVQAADTALPALSFAEPFTITIDDVNEAPADIQLSPDTVAENLPAGTTVGRLTTSDPDTGQSFTYSLVDTAGCPGTDNASFALGGDTLLTAGPFDFEVRSSYTICIRSTDNGVPNLSFDKPLTITITGTNDPPTDITLSADTVAENQPSGTLVGSLATTDPEIGQTFTYSLVDVSGCPGSDNASFSISGDTLRTAEAFDYEARSSYSLCIQTTDDGVPNLSYHKAFTIGVIDANDAPTDIQLSGTTLAENQPVGTLIGNLSVTDQDAGQTFTYALVDNAGCSGPDNAMFAVSGDELITAAPIDFEAAGTRTICVQTTDNGTPNLSFEKQIVVTITDLNEVPADIMLTSTTVMENRPAGTLVGNLATSDPDAGQAFTYSLVDATGCPGTDNASFAIDGDSLRTAASFDYEATPHFTICVRSTDNGIPNLSLDKPFTIDVTNANEAPLFTSAGATTFTAEISGAFTVTTMGDPAAQISITGGTLPSGLTFVDNGDGTATLSGTPTIGTGGMHTFTITAANAAGSAEQVFTLEIDERPTLTSADRVTFSAEMLNTFTVISHGFPVAALSQTGTLPDGVTFQDNRDGTASLSGTPARTATGIYRLVITAQNGIGSSARQDFTLTIENRPQVMRVNSVPDTGDGQIVEDERVGVAVRQLLIGFNNDMAPGLAADASNYRLVMAPDAPIGIGSVSYDQATRTATLNLNGGQPLAGGSYTLTARSNLEDTAGFTMAADFVRHFAVDLDPPVVLFEGLLAYPGGIHIFNDGSYDTHFTSLYIPFDTDVHNPAGAADPEDVTNPANYLLIQAGPNGQYDTTSCRNGLAMDDIQIPTGPVTYANHQGVGPFAASLALNQGVPLPSGDYLLLICGSTSIVDEAGNPLNGGTDSRIRFSIFDPAKMKLPQTGFAPGVVTALTDQPAARAYADLGDVWLEIPSLHIKAPISGIPSLEETWDLTWLSKQVGWLEGTAFPSWKGNSVLTAHVYNADGTPGLFVSLKNLTYGQEIILHAFGYRYTYAVRANQSILPKNTGWVFQHQEQSWLTLLTCEGYDPETNTYDSRRALRAVLVSIKAE
ncbi:MAG: sortase [Chloroflexi bacterium]|nr:sortase [Chloroflexota bacterium]